MSVALFHRIMGEGPTLFILHGLFGSSDNWQTHAKTLSEHFQVVLVDQRNHGHSPHDSEMNYDVMAEDLHELMLHLGVNRASFIGHSMGGKTIMRFAQIYPNAVERMIVADMGIRAYPPHHDLVFQGLFHVDVDHCPSRKDAEERLTVFVSELSTRQFLMKNLYWLEPGKLAWRFNLSALSEQRTRVMEAIPEETCPVNALFLTGGNSQYVVATDHPAILAIFPHATFQEMAGVGHWLHAEDPQGFLRNVMQFLAIP